MGELHEFVRNHTVRGDCTCGLCFDGKDNPEQPEGHTADLIFFKVAKVGDPNKATLRRLIEDNNLGDFADVDLFDGKEHGYIELGAWIGDQGLALMLMGLGTLLGLWKLMTPRTILPAGSADEDLIMQMAGQGLVTVISS